MPKIGREFEYDLTGFLQDFSEFFRIPAEKV